MSETWNALPNPFRVKSTLAASLISIFLAPIVARPKLLSLLVEFTFPSSLTVRLLFKFVSLTILLPVCVISFSVNVLFVEVLGAKFTKPFA